MTTTELVAELRDMRKEIQYAARLSDVAIDWSERLDRAIWRLEALESALKAAEAML